MMSMDNRDPSIEKTRNPKIILSKQYFENIN